MRVNSSCNVAVKEELIMVVREFYYPEYSLSPLAFVALGRMVGKTGSVNASPIHKYADCLHQFC